MIKVVVDHQVKDKQHIAEFIDIMKKLTGEAIKSPGYLTGETMVNTEDECNILVIAMWRNIKNYQDWYTKEIRQQVEGMCPSILTEVPRIRMFEYALEKRGRVWSTF
jgi:quinol monooxygenase YgiN